MIAGVYEYRLATISALAASLLLVLLLVVPSWFLPEQTRIVSKANRPKTTAVKTVLRHPATLAANLHMKVENRPKYGYYVQTGAFKDAIKAKKLASLLRHSGWHIHMISTKENLHAVLAGPLKTRKKAEDAKLKLARQSGIKGFIIFMPPGN